MGNSVLSKSGGNTIDKSDLSLPYADLTPDQKLENDIKEFGSDTTLLVRLLDICERYIDTFIPNKNCEELSQEEHETFYHEWSLRTITKFLKTQFKTVSNTAYSRDNAHPDKIKSNCIRQLRIQPKNTIYAIFQFREAIKTNTDFHDSLAHLKSSDVQIFDNNIIDYLVWSSFCVGNNNVFIQFIELIQKWVSEFNDVDLSLHPVLEKRFNDIINLKLTPVTFMPINDVMQTVYTNSEYINQYGKTLIYFYLTEPQSDTTENSEFQIEIVGSTKSKTITTSSSEYRVCYDITMPRFDNHEERKTTLTDNTPQSQADFSKIDIMSGSVPSPKYGGFKSKVSHC
jgi:hypothetical protein